MAAVPHARGYAAVYPRMVELSSHLPSVGRRLDCVRQFRGRSPFTGARTMKPSGPKKETKAFSDAVGRGLRRAARAARKTARMHGTPIWIWKDGKIVALKP